MKISHSQISYQKQPISTLRELSPKRQQWALINQYKALQFERQKQRQRMIAQQKRDKFKRQLDNQLSSKQNVHQKQVQADRRYYEFIVQKANQQKQKEEHEKIEKLIKRRQVQEDNARLLQLTKNSRTQQSNPTDVFEIGLRSQIQHKNKSQYMKRTVLDTLDQQLRIKQQQKMRSRQEELQTLRKNMEYQDLYEMNRNNKNKNYRQNQNVYQYYNELERQRRMKELQIEHRLVDQAALKKMYQEDQRKRNEQMKKAMIKQEVKQTLDQQVKQHHLKKLEQARVNPQQYSYGVIGNVFRPRQQSYDKNKYFEQLRRQAEQQKLKKKKENFMSEEEYKLNINQLNKVVTGEYAYNTYVDRSMGTIGDRKQLNNDIGESIHDRDAQVIKERLEMLRNRNRSQIIDKHDRSAFF